MRVQLLPLHALPTGVESAWSALAAVAAEPNPFFEPAAALPAAQQLADGRDALLLTAVDGDAMVFALPVQRRSGYRRLPVSAMTSWQHEYCFLGTPLLARDGGTEAWRAVLRFLRADPAARWLALERMPLDGAVAQALAEALRAERLPSTTTDAYERPVLRRRPEATYLDGRISPRHLKSQRRLRRRLSASLGDEVRAVDRAGDPAAVESLLGMEAAGWKGDTGTAMACRAGDAEFFRELCRRFSDQRRLQLWSLEAAGRTAAYQCNLLAGDTVFHYKIAYDAELAACSPGLQLELDMITEFHADRALAQIDSCVDPGNRVSTQLYPDRRTLVTRLLPLGGLLGAAATRGLPLLVSTRRAIRDAAARRAEP